MTQLGLAAGEFVVATCDIWHDHTLAIAGDLLVVRKPACDKHCAIVAQLNGSWSFPVNANEVRRAMSHEISRAIRLARANVARCEDGANPS